jgi:hypothetical protein
VNLWHDETGAIVSAELTVILAIVVAGTAVGATRLRDAINAELADLSAGIRSLDQSGFIEAVRPVQRVTTHVEPQCTVVLGQY